MTKEEVLGRINDVLAGEFEIDRAKLVPEARLFEDLDLDSIDAVDLVVRMQQQTSLKENMKHGSMWVTNFQAKRLSQLLLPPMLLDSASLSLLMRQALL